ncbi:MAG: pirin family protein, partial [Gammaproteobacteria bacterium]|nr:pirin family protein [Gammaproteobacteria bacterium]
QLWINLPAANKMSSPEYQEYSPLAIPVVASPTMQVKIICGDYADKKGLITDPITQVQYLDVQLKNGQLFTHTLDDRFNCFIYLFEGDAEYADRYLPEQTMLVLGEGDTVSLKPVKNDCRFILVGGLPIGEPVVQYGPFVMNSKEEIEQALSDYRNGRLVIDKAAFRTDG